jgi:hypothetical protein
MPIRSACSPIPYTATTPGWRTRARARLFQQRRAVGSVFIERKEEFEGYLALEPLVPGAPDLTAAAGAGKLQEREVPPLLRDPRGMGLEPPLEAPAAIDEALEVAQLAEHDHVAGISVPSLDELPVDGLPVQYGSCDAVEPLLGGQRLRPVLSAHVPSFRPACARRAGQPCVLRRGFAP